MEDLAIEAVVSVFLLTVFATHSLTVYERARFYEMLGLDPAEFDEKVIRKTNETSLRAFPVALDIDHPEFFKRLKRCAEQNLKIRAIDNSDQPQLVKFFRKLPLISTILGHLLRIFLIKPIDAEALRGSVA